MMRMSAGTRAAVQRTQTLKYKDAGGGPVRRFGPIETMSDGENTIALFCTLESDAVFLKAMLRELGYISLRKVSLLSEKQGRKPATYAAIVCHRYRHSFSESSLELSGLANRVIALSDCMDEETVIDFLTNGARHFFDICESPSILQARLSAALRHHQSSMMDSLTVGDIKLDRQHSTAIRDGRRIKLTPKEFAFACQLFSKVGQVVCNEELMTSIWSLPANMDTRRIDSAASLVRKKLRLVCSEGWELKRIRCVGYQLNRISDNPL